MNIRFFMYLSLLVRRHYSKPLLSLDLDDSMLNLIISDAFLLSRCQNGLMNIGQFPEGRDGARGCDGTLAPAHTIFHKFPL